MTTPDFSELSWFSNANNRDHVHSTSGGAQGALHSELVKQNKAKTISYAERASQSLTAHGRGRSSAHLRGRALLVPLVFVFHQSSGSLLIRHTRLVVIVAVVVVVVAAVALVASLLIDEHSSSVHVNPALIF